MKDLKPWMINHKMWSSGCKANKWRKPSGWDHLGWFSTRDPNWTQPTTDYFDFTFSIMLQQDSGWA